MDDGPVFSGQGSETQRRASTLCTWQIMKRT